jgi:hypothetical protein
MDSLRSTVSAVEEAMVVASTPALANASVELGTSDAPVAEVTNQRSPASIGELEYIQCPFPIGAHPFQRSLF